MFDYNLSAKENTKVLIEGHTSVQGPEGKDIRHVLNYGHSLRLQVRETAEGKKSDKSRLCGLLCGAAMKKSRMMKELASNLRVSERRLRGIKEVTGELKPKKRNVAWKERITELVTNFYETDEISRMNPGKKDKVDVLLEDGTKRKVTYQSRVLNDYQEINFDNFKREFPEDKDRICRSLFYALRPKWVLTSANLKGFSCLCTKHENLGLLLKAAKPYYEEPIPVNPDSFHRKVETKENCEELLKTGAYEAVVEDDMIPVRQWKSVKSKEMSKKTGKEKTVYKTKCKSDLVPFSNLKNLILAQYEAFIQHSFRIKNQYAVFKYLKETLRVGELIIWMDYSENYMLKAADAVQGAYWNQQFVTMHCICVYYRLEEGGELQHQSYVYISGVMAHTSAFVITCIKSLLFEDLPKVTGKDFKVRWINYVTDSPLNQYRNRYIALFDSIHPQLFGCVATHHFCETGHGKSVCDGIGGSMKRRADQAVYQGRVNITNVVEFFQYAKDHEKQIKAVFVPMAAYAATLADVELWKAFTVPITGTLGLHCIVGMKEGVVAHNHVSCDCDRCRDFDPAHCTKHTYEIVDITQPKQLPRGKKVPFLPENLTACTNVDRVPECQYLCTCEYVPIDNTEADTLHYRQIEEELLAEDTDEVLPAYVGQGSIPTDLIQQNGTFI